MSGTGDDTVGYGRPPRATRWKKGQTGNPGKVHSKKPKKSWKIVETVLATETTIVENGERRRVTLFEAIALKLWAKAATGDKRAFKVLQRYEAFAKTKPDTYVKRVAQCLDRIDIAFRLAFVGCSPPKTPKL